MLMNDAGPGPTILIVDDDRLLRSLAVETLNSEGYVAAGVANAAEALARLQEPSNVTLLVTDINMPGMSGLDLVRLVQESSPGIRILVISGREQVNADLLPDRAAFLQKPFSAKGFVACIRHLLDDCA